MRVTIKKFHLDVAGRRVSDNMIDSSGRSLNEEWEFDTQDVHKLLSELGLDANLIYLGIQALISINQYGIRMK